PVCCWYSGCVLLKPSTLPQKITSVSKLLPGTGTLLMWYGFSWYWWFICTDSCCIEKAGHGAGLFYFDDGYAQMLQDMEMNIKKWLLLPWYVLSIGGQAKSFKENPVIGSKLLNRL